MSHDLLIATAAVVPIRREPSDAAEMVSQLLLGETARVLAHPRPLWYEIETHLDGYVGYVCRTMVETPASGWVPPDASGDLVRVASRHATILVEEEPWLLPMGSRLRLFPDGRVGLPDGRTGAVADPSAHFRPDAASRPPSAAEDGPVGLRMLAVARQLVGTPYLWAGRSSFGIDCSGLTQLAALLNGFRMPRDSYQQYALGEAVPADLDRMETGDLVFFSSDPRTGRITHVALYEGGGRILHASGRVRWNSLDPDEPLFSKRCLDTMVGARRLYSRHLHHQDGRSRPEGRTSVRQ